MDATTGAWPEIAWRTWATSVSVTHDPEDSAHREVDLERLDDAELARACASGRREAFDVIVTRHRRSVYQLCYRFAGNPEDAADLSQEVFLRAYRAIGGFKGQASLATWLYRIGVNVCLNKVGGKAPRTEPIEEGRPLPAGGPSVVDRLLAAERAAGVRAAIARLPDKQRAALILRVYHDLPHQEIAAILGSSEGAVKANFFHALRRLRTLLSEETR